ncbi:sodium ion-translocating decarboxylase subunit beta [Chloroflexus sp.]|uniref:sodium ion-translocating decarboxylase subunit beta n=1 Tax=Chloroflexus sp. TaxID=1904827 RepID=UPI002ACE68EE|nr:sodium ion-translocating decarboxylase subunit beta [Chloroflexus sp.]
MEWLIGFFEASGLAHLSWGNLLMIVVGCVFVYLAIARGFEPLLLVPIGFGIILGNMPFEPGMGQGVYDQGSVLNYIYFGVIAGVFPPLIFLGIGAMTDFSALIAQPRLILLGAAAQIGIFFTLMMAVFLGSRLPFLNLASADDPLRLLRAAAAIGIIGGADGPTAIFIATRLAPDLLGAIAVSAYSYMALVPVIQPPIMRLLTTREERLIRMPPPAEVSRAQRILFPIIGLIVCVLIVPDTLPLLGMLFFGNLLKESGVTERLAKTARSALIDSVTIMLGLTVGASTQASNFLTPRSVAIFALGACAFAISTAGGVLFAKFYNLFTNNKINPLIGAAGVSAVPMSARVAHGVAQAEDKQNFLIWQAMCPNVAGVIGSAVAAGVLLVILR